MSQDHDDCAAVRFAQFAAQEAERSLDESPVTPFSLQYGRGEYLAGELKSGRELFLFDATDGVHETKDGREIPLGFPYNFSGNNVIIIEGSDDNLYRVEPLPDSYEVTLGNKTTGEEKSLGFLVLGDDIALKIGSGVELRTAETFEIEEEGRPITNPLQEVQIERIKRVFVLTGKKADSKKNGLQVLNPNYVRGNLDVSFFQPPAMPRASRRLG